MDNGQPQPEPPPFLIEGLDDDLAHCLRYAHASGADLRTPELICLVQLIRSTTNIIRLLRSPKNEHLDKQFRNLQL